MEYKLLLEAAYLIFSIAKAEMKKRGKTEDEINAIIEADFREVLKRPAKDLPK